MVVACVCELALRTQAFPPSTIKILPNITVAAGQYLQYQFDASSFQSNKVGGLLIYTLLDASALSLPAWVTFYPNNISIQGTPVGGQDTQYAWSLTATDRDGEKTSQNFTFNSFATCPAGSFRHFRVKLSPGNQASYYEPPYIGSYICSLLWKSTISVTNETYMEDPFPSTYIPAFNISGTTYAGSSAYSDQAAPPQLGFGDPDGNTGGCNFYNSWKVSTQPTLLEVLEVQLRSSEP